MYHTIQSILSPALKILEQLLLPALQERLPATEHPHGFRSRRSTTSALLPLFIHIATDFKQPKPPSRSIALAIEFSKPFNTVDHKQLIDATFGWSAP